MCATTLGDCISLVPWFPRRNLEEVGRFNFRSKFPQLPKIVIIIDDRKWGRYDIIVSQECRSGPFVRFLFDPLPSHSAVLVMVRHPTPSVVL